MKWLLVGVLGAIACTLCDRVHVGTGVLSYAHPAAFGEAWWVPLLFFGASLAAVAGAGPVRALFRAPPAFAPKAREIAADGIAFVTAYCFTGFHKDHPTGVALVLGAWWLARVVRGRPAWMIAYSLIVGVVGAGFEAALAGAGGFVYHVPDAVGVPRWLPMLYWHAALLAAPLYDLLAARSRPAISRE